MALKSSRQTSLKRHITQEDIENYVEESPTILMPLTQEQKNEAARFSSFLSKSKDKYWRQVGVNIGDNLLEEILTIAYNVVKESTQNGIQDR